jgi:hypothetical protein
MLRQPIVTEPPDLGCCPAAEGEAEAFSGALAAAEALALELAVLALLGLLVLPVVFEHAPRVRVIKNASRSARIRVAFFI